jgi:hypothetical protein
MRFGDRIGMLPRTPEDKLKGVLRWKNRLTSRSRTRARRRASNAWRVEQLGKLELSTIIADAVATLVDWHEVARLVQKGCPPELALEIAR